MVAKQLSIFLENKSGRLTEVTEVLAKEGVNLSALCIAENADFGILRGIVSEPDKAYKVLKDNHFAVNVTDVVGISCPNIPGSLAKVPRIAYPYSLRGIASGSHTLIHHFSLLIRAASFLQSHFFVWLAW